MIHAHKMTALGLPAHPELIPLAQRTMNVYVAGGCAPEAALDELEKLLAAPESFAGHPALGELARALSRLYPNGLKPLMRKEPAPWTRFGDINLEASAIRQMENACLLPDAVRGALMPDAHTGYGLPIGGVLALKGAVVPYAVGMDIACRMRLTVTDLPVKYLDEGADQLAAALENETGFGIGAGFEGSRRRQHAVMDEDWGITKVTRSHKDKAAKQLGSSGSGNHFVEFGELSLSRAALGLEPGIYLALLSHSGSRGTGEAVAKHYSRLAADLLPGLPAELKHLAWLDLKSEAGQEYWAAMELMGRYASANHQLIHQKVLQAAGARALTFVENHHNFAWREIHDGEEVVVHRKGATPAGEGVLGVVPGSMGAPGFVVRGRGQGLSLNSCSHGAGRLMSRTEAFKRFSAEEVREYLTARRVRLISGGLDEAPMAYKDINEVMNAQKDLVDILARFDPRIVKMAPPEKRSWK